MTRFRLNPQLDADELARTFGEQSRVRIPGLLADGADALRGHFEERDDWWHLVGNGHDVAEYSRADRARMSGKRRAELEAEVHERARTGFQYRYEALRVPERDDEDWSDDDPLSEFARFLAEEPILALVRRILGHDEIAFSEGQATAYGPGDFLTCHDDDVAGRGRLAAFVFGLTPGWRPDWGGLLLFHGRNGGPLTAHAPQFNTLDLFKVPQLHSVSMVTPAATAPRYSLTGWVRRTD